jgi:hypothetical protein
MRRGGSTRGVRIVATLFLVLVLVGGSASGADIVPTSSAPPSTTSQPVYGVQVDPDNVLLQVSLQPDGSGDWRVEYRIRLDDENTTDAFERHREQIESDPDTYRERFATDMQATISTAENTTGREMSLANVTVDVTRERLPQRYGIITYTFEWNGFAVTNDSAIEAGDALEGIFLDSETTLLVTWPDTYRRVSVSPPPHEVRDRSVVWSGSMHFGTDEPDLVVSREGSTGTPVPTSNRGGGTTAGTAVTSPGEGRVDGVGDGDGPNDENGRQFAVPLFIGLGVVILLALLGAIYRGSLELPFDDAAGDSSEGGGSPSELLSNEEQVLTLLKEHGGRMKQQEVAAELDWTDAKTSKVIRQMRDEDELETFRLGRENVVTLPDTDLADDDI